MDGLKQVSYESLGETLPSAPVPPRPGGGRPPVLHRPHRTEDPVPAGATSRYAIEEVLASGGMGTIRRAVDLNVRRPVAMKVLLSGRDASHQHLMRFVEEAQITGQLEHPNIVPVHELGRDEHGNVYYTMKLVQGHTLKSILQEIREGKKATIEHYPLNALLNIYLKACDAVAFAHSRGVIHRDLKPENIMVGEFGEVQVMDWGLAKVMSEASVATGQASNGPRLVDPQDAKAATPVPTAPTPAPRVESVRSTGLGDSLLTVAGQVMGTPSFMSPEQARGEVKELDHRTDVYSLGAILYTILTLRPPVEGRTLQEILSRTQEGAIEAPTAFNTSMGTRTRMARSRSTGTRGGARRPGGASGAGSAAPGSAGGASAGPGSPAPAGTGPVGASAGSVQPQPGAGASVGSASSSAAAAPGSAVMGGASAGGTPAGSAPAPAAAAGGGDGSGAAGAASAPVAGPSPAAQPLAVIRLAHCPHGRVPAALSAVAMKALAFRAENRYQSVQAVQADVQAYLDGFATSAEEATMLRLIWLLVKRHRREVLLICGFLAILLSVAAGLMVRVSRERTRALVAMKLAEDRLADLTRQQNENAALSRQASPEFLNKARVFLERREWGQALDALSVAENLDPGSPEVRIQKGRAHLAQQEFGLAAAAFIKASELASPGTDDAKRAGLYLDVAKQGLSAPRGSDGRLGADQAVLLVKRLEDDVSDDLLAGALCGDLTRREDLMFRAAVDALFLLNPGLKREQVQYLAPSGGRPSIVCTDNPRLVDISPLAKLPGDSITLVLSGTGVRDLSPLSGLPVSVLRIDSTGVRDVSALRGMPLKQLDLSNLSNLRDLRPLAECRELERLAIPVHCNDIEFLRTLPKLKILDNSKRLLETLRSASDFWAAYDARKKAK